MYKLNLKSLHDYYCYMRGGTRKLLEVVSDPKIFKPNLVLLLATWVNVRHCCPGGLRGPSLTHISLLNHQHVYC